MVLPGDQRGVFPEVFGAKQTLRDSPSADSADSAETERNHTQSMPFQ
jgi:hypothetical protein